MDKLRILVCGGRHFDDYDLLEKTINDVIAESGANRYRNRQRALRRRG